MQQDMVVKAFSWALRTLSRKDPRAVAAFMTEYRDRLAARVIRETNNKLKTGLKNPPPPRGTKRPAERT